MKYLKLAYWTSLVMAIATLAALGIIDQHLKTDASPLGIVSFELCAFSSTCAATTAAWGEEARLMAAMSLGLDYLFMVAYPMAICCGLLVLAPRLPGRFAGIATWLAWLVWVAGVADAVENYHLFQMLLGHSVDTHQWPATMAASIKFAALTPALLAWLVFAAWAALRSSAVDRGAGPRRDGSRPS
ncbi:MAG: hypothetical protein EOP40_04455 [Rubrivivax sp.]|nr:MAG: hypothetical protein EOP40_04455 [Rubrivivax sp.]